MYLLTINVLCVIIIWDEVIVLNKLSKICAIFIAIGSVFVVSGCNNSIDEHDIVTNDVQAQPSYMDLLPEGREQKAKEETHAVTTKNVVDVSLDLPSDEDLQEPVLLEDYFKDSPLWRLSCPGDVVYYIVIDGESVFAEKREACHYFSTVSFSYEGTSKDMILNFGEFTSFHLVNPNRSDNTIYLADINNQKSKYAYALSLIRDVDINTYFERLPDNYKSGYAPKCCDDDDCGCGCNDWWLTESCHEQDEGNEDDCCGTPIEESTDCCDDETCDCGCNGYYTFIAS